MTSKVTKAEPKEPTIMEVIQQIASSPNAKDQVEIMRELLAIKERAEASEAKRAFDGALHQMQAKIRISRDGAIMVKGEVRSRYATIDQLDDVLRPLMSEHGFSFQMSEVGVEGEMRVFAGTLRHTMGYQDTLLARLPLDRSDFRTQVQSEGSTISYARRQLYKLHFNIVERSQDDDGSGKNVQPIDPEQARDIETMIADTSSNKDVFLAYFRIKNVADLKKADLPLAMEMLQHKQKKRAKKHEDPQS